MLQFGNNTMGDDSNWAEDYNRETDEKLDELSGTFTENLNSAVSTSNANYEGTLEDTGQENFDLNQALETIGSPDAETRENERYHHGDNNVIKKSGGLNGYTLGAKPDQ